MNEHNKGYILLSMHDTLINGNGINIHRCMAEYKISIATFRRYIALLRVFYADRYGADIAYDGNTEQYKVCK